MQREINKKVRLYGVAAILFAVILVSMCYQLGYIPQISPQEISPFMSTFASYDELAGFLRTKSQAQYGYPYYTRDGGIFLFGGPEAKTNVPQAADADLSHSTTNIQVAGVDEADIVKVDDQGYIYLLTDTNISILKAYPPDQTQLVSTIAVEDMWPAGIFVNGDRLAVLGSNYTMVQGPEYYSRMSYFADTTTYARVYDISNRSEPRSLKNFTTSGDYLNSRMIGDYVYFVASQAAYYRLEILPNITVDKVNLPKIAADGQSREVAASQIYYSNVTDEYFMFTTIVALNIKDTAQEPSSKTLMVGAASTMYVSLSDIFVTYSGGANTTIYRIHIEDSNITPAAQGIVPGYVLNQFSMDQYGDYFRIATTSWNNLVVNNATKETWIGGMQQTNVYVMDMNLTIVGKLEGLAPGEDLHSARFMGNRCYLVTFVNIDPLFVIDLSDPTKPAVLGELKIPGYSDYLHPYDENHLIGVGKETVPAEQDFFAWYQGIKISLFDVSNVSNPVQEDVYIIGDRGSDSPVLRDHKAFLFDKSKNLLVIPVMVAKVDETQYPPGRVPANAYGQPIWQGAYVFNLTLENGFVFRGGITHVDDSANLQDSKYHVDRALYIENALYTVSNMKVKVNDLENLAFIGEVKLN